MGNLNLLYTNKITMRVLFFTAAAIAACVATVGQAVRLEAEPNYEFAELNQGAPAAGAGGNAVKMSLNGETGEYSMMAGPKATEETQDAVINALMGKMGDLNKDDKRAEDAKAAVESQKKLKPMPRKRRSRAKREWPIRRTWSRKRR